MGARCRTPGNIDGIAVSIHTPPWGRDWTSFSSLPIFTVSIHTPPWGRDSTNGYCYYWCGFQFTRPRGGAIVADKREFSPEGFNSHAPVGARWNRRYRSAGHACFNSHAPVGARFTCAPAQTSTSSFNSHAPVGARWKGPCRR